MRMKQLAMRICPNCQSELVSQGHISEHVEEFRCEECGEVYQVRVDKNDDSCSER